MLELLLATAIALLPSLLLVLVSSVSYPTQPTRLLGISAGLV